MKISNILKRLKLFLVVITIMVILTIFSSASVPPANLYGFILENGFGVEDGTVLTVKGNCFGSGVEDLVMTQTIYGNGYYDFNIKFDDEQTAIDEGCSTGQEITIEYLDQKEILTLSAPGSSLRYDITFETENTEEGEEPNEEITNIENLPSKKESTGGGGGGGGPSGDYEITITPIKEKPVEVSKIPIPPINYWGFIYIKNKTTNDGFIINVQADCYENGIETITTGTTGYGTGYYDIYIPIDDPKTKEDEGCEPNDEISFISDGFIPINGSTLKLGNSGQSLQNNIYFNGKEITTDKPADIIKQMKEDNNEITALFDNSGLEKHKIFLIVLGFVAFLLTILAIFDYKKKKEEKDNNWLNENEQ